MDDSTSCCLSFSCSQSGRKPCVFPTKISDGGEQICVRNHNNPKNRNFGILYISREYEPITPISFLDYIARRLGLIVADSTFTCFFPSVMAIVVMLQVMDGVEPGLNLEFQNQLLGNLRIDKKWQEQELKETRRTSAGSA
ncbi:hypothetical protein GQ457_14G004680 [Hibiscus cannabinus]